MGKKKRKTPAIVDPDAPLPEPTPPPPPKIIDPKWKWPPFPKPPEGVTIIPFDEFKPKGLQVPFEGEAEVDGEGVPTIQLMVKHNLDPGAIKRKKKKNKDGPYDEIKANLTWYERWELNEDARMVVSQIDQSDSLTDRFLMSLPEFHRGRVWSAHLQGLWDQFRIFVGEIRNVQRPRGVKNLMKHDMVPNDGDSSDEDFPDMTGVSRNEEVNDDNGSEYARNDESDADYQPMEEENPDSTPKERERARKLQQKYQHLQTLVEKRKEFFMTETEKAVKIYLSSFFRDRGLMWSEPNVRDAPKLLLFFLRFLERNARFLFRNPLTDQPFRQGILDAIPVAEKATKELPFTYVLSRALPGKWAKACIELWGFQNEPDYKLHIPRDDEEIGGSHKDIDTNQPSVEGWLDDTDDQGPNAKLMDVAFDLGKGKKIHATAAESEWQAVVEETQVLNSQVTDINEGATIEEMDEDIGVPSIANESEPLMSAEHVEEKEEFIKEDTNDGWGSVMSLDWGQPEDESWGTLDTPLIFPFVGPSSIPFSHIPVRLEVSTRMLIDYRPPTPECDDHLEQRLATLVFAPWPSPSNHPDSCVQFPSMTPYDPTRDKDSDIRDAARSKTKEHDPNKDIIEIFVEPEVLKVFDSGVGKGMGVGGTWVQVAPKDGAELPASKPWWYLQQVVQVIPSYWTEQIQDLDITLWYNNPAYAYDSSVSSV